LKVGAQFLVAILLSANLPAFSADETMDLPQARQFMLSLINRDRAKVGATPVTLDDVANRAGQLHSDEMAQIGYLSHWTMDGRKPDQRYNECGGKDRVAENVDATLETTQTKLPLCKNQQFSKRDLEEIEAQFFDEKPPNDGHRVNIIDVNHTSVGIGLSAACRAEEERMPRVACTQEFINHFGTYGDIPDSIKAGDAFLYEGTMNSGMQFQSIDLRFEKMPEPMTFEQLNATSSYGIPDDATYSYFQPPYESPAPVNLSETEAGQHFSLNIQTTKQWKPGLYYVCLWATPKNAKEATLISTRTFKLQNK